ncbi:MAG: Crp/Fnr family transcriptional regulator [Flavobacterium sp.]|nr:MAG: Crp/Fnr family transcriptional regulator [Flavobacterium sp.]
MNNTHHALKLKISAYGAIRPKVWAKLLPQLKVCNLKPGEIFPRPAGSIAYIERGLLKEYDFRDRKKPSIVNFIFTDEFLPTPKHEQRCYVMAVTTSILYYLEFDELLALFFEYRELIHIHDAIFADYDETLAFRNRLLEQKVAVVKIQAFIDKHRELIAFLKKKDIANYIHVEYDHFTRVFSKMV